MTDVLSELRDAIQSNTTWRQSSWKQWKQAVLASVDAFEAAHPKIVDLETVTTADLSRLGFSVHLCTKGDSCTKAGP